MSFTPRSAALFTTFSVRTKSLAQQKSPDVGSVAECVEASFLQRPWSNYLGSTRTQVTLLRPWIRRFTMIISTWRLQTRSNSVDKNSKKSTGTLDHRKLQRGADSSNHEVVLVIKSVRIVLQVSVWRCPVTGGYICATTTALQQKQLLCKKILSLPDITASRMLCWSA